MSSTLELLSVNTSVAKGTVKQPVERIVVGPEGVDGDAHAGPWHRQVSLLDQGCIERFAQRLGRPIGPGEFAENLTIRGLEASAVAPLDRLHLGEVELEVTQIGKQCHGTGCAVFREVGRCVMPEEGIFARVLRGGTLVPGLRGEFLPRTLRFHVVTLSDRAAAGHYEDRSGPRLRELLEAWLAGRRWHAAVTGALLPDDALELHEELLRARREGVDVALTAGGTGVGPRDYTPEVVAELCDRQLPGIMDHIRLKYGASNPRALLSRSIAGTSQRMQIYALPGSVRAVEEYLGEILKTVEHVLYMLHGLDVH